MRNYNSIAVIDHIETTMIQRGVPTTVHDLRGVTAQWNQVTDFDGVTRLYPSEQKIHDYPFAAYHCRTFDNAAGRTQRIFIQQDGISRILFLEEINGVVTLCTDQDYMPAKVA